MKRDFIKMIKIIVLGIAASNVESLRLEPRSLPRYSRNLASRVHLPQLSDITFLFSSLSIDNPVEFLEEAAGIGFMGKATQVNIFHSTILFLFLLLFLVLPAGVKQ